MSRAVLPSTERNQLIRAWCGLFRTPGLSSPALHHQVLTSLLERAHTNVRAEEEAGPHSLQSVRAPHSRRETALRSPTTLAGEPQFLMLKSALIIV